MTRVAIVHDWLTGQRGGENVLEAILELFPSAEIFTLFHFPGRVSPAIESHPIHTSGLQRLAAKVPNYRHLLPLFPRAVRAWDFSRFDLVISSSHAVAKGVDTGRAPHVCYCHTPMRYVWDRFDDYFRPGRPLTRLAANVLAGPLREWDRRTAAGVDAFVANSRFVRDRIRRFYGRDAEVIYPFVHERFLEKKLAAARGGYHLVVSALAPYKRIEVAVAAANAGRERLVVVGSGPEERRLREMAGETVEFRGFVPDGEVVELMSRAESLLIPGVEDFGITPLEAAAAGAPVVAIAEGGATETVVDGMTGILVPRATPGTFLEAMRRAKAIAWNRDEMRRRAAAFSRRRFQEEFRTLVEGVLAAG